MKVKEGEIVRRRALGLSKAVMLGAVFGVLMLMGFSLFPAAPPIIAVPALASFYLGLTIPLSDKQWLIALVGFLILMLGKGGLILPGPFILPLYGVIFTSRRAMLAGAISSLLHVLYGVFLAPMIFAVAPATRIMNFILQVIGRAFLGVMFILLLYALAGALAAYGGLKVGRRIRRLTS